MFKINKKKIKPYGDRLDDGMIQLSFTLPIKASAEAKEAARLYVDKLGLERAHVVAMESMGDQFTYFVVYAHAKPTIDVTRIHVPKADIPEFNYKELVKTMDDSLDRKLVVIGACTGSDAHTVGIDAILNMKGFAGDYGLERYPKFAVHNLRSQLSNEELVRKAAELKADALLISQIVTQRDTHIDNLKELHSLIKKEKGVSEHLITIIGGPRIDHSLALKLGFDAGFGKNTLPSQVATFIVQNYCKRAGRAFVIPGKKESRTAAVSKTATMHMPDKPQSIQEEALQAVREKGSKKSAAPSTPSDKPPSKRRGKRGGRRRGTRGGHGRKRPEAKK
jgi:beta-lysine 5,6-aminomutase beta subunit